jgi:hypothetical protein
MAYIINKTDGTILTTVSDGQIDNLSTDLTLIGKNFSGFGESLNENFVKLLENFAGISRPSRPIRGQIWFDVTELKLKVYNGVSFQPVSSATISNTQPRTLTPGDLWFNDIDKQLYFFDGITPILLGPDFSTSQGISGFRIRTVLDNLNQSRVITLLYTNGVLIGIFSKDEFIPKLPIDGFEGQIFVGFNQVLSDQSFRFVTTASNADTLGKDPNFPGYSNGIPSDAYIKNYTNGIIDGRLGITRGIEIGEGFSGRFQFDQNNNLIISNSSAGRFLLFQARRDQIPEDAIKIEPSSRSVRIYENFINSKLLAGGDLEVSGNLIVKGTMTSVSSSMVTIEDKNIELAVPSSGSPSDANAEGGGITLKGDYDYTIAWTKPDPLATGGQWNINQTINLTSIPGTSDTASLWIDGIEILKKTGSTFELTNAVTIAEGIEFFGKVTRVDIGPGLTTDPAFLRLEDSRISTLLGLNLELAPAGDIQIVGNKKIVGLGIPTANSDAANKKYVDDKLKAKTLVLTFDTSDGISNNGIIFWLNQIAPDPNTAATLVPPQESEYANGTVAKILCSTTSNTTNVINITPNLNISTGTFVTPTGVADAVVQPVGVSPITLPAPAVLVNRIVKTFQIQGGSWIFIS